MFLPRPVIASLFALVLSSSTYAACGSATEVCEPTVDDARIKIEQILGTAYLTAPKIISLEKLDGRSVQTQNRKIYEMRIFAAMTYAGEKLECRIKLCPQLSNYLVEIDERSKKATMAGWLFFESTDRGWR